MPMDLPEGGKAVFSRSRTYYNTVSMPILYTLQMHTHALYSTASPTPGSSIVYMMTEK